MTGVGGYWLTHAFHMCLSALVTTVEQPWMAQSYIQDYLIAKFVSEDLAQNQRLQMNRRMQLQKSIIIQLGTIAITES